MAVKGVCRWCGVKSGKDALCKRCQGLKNAYWDERVLYGRLPSHLADVFRYLESRIYMLEVERRRLLKRLEKK